MQEQTSFIEAQKWILSKGSIRFLNYVAENGTAILERAYLDLKIPKPTLGYHKQRLERLGLIENAGLSGRTKPVKLTRLGQSVVNLLKGETMPDNDRIRISAIGLVVSLGLDKLTKQELRKVIRLFQDYIEKNEKPTKKDLGMVV